MDLPDEVMESLQSLQVSVKAIRDHIAVLKSGPPLRELLEESDSIEKSKLYAALGYSLDTLWFMYLRVHGQDPSNHQVHKELERVKKYIIKVKQAAKEHSATAAAAAAAGEATDTMTMESSSGGDQATTRIDTDAANRFIRSALSGSLTEEQKQQFAERNEMDVSDDSRKRNSSNDLQNERAPKAPKQ